MQFLMSLDPMLASILLISAIGVLLLPYGIWHSRQHKKRAHEKAIERLRSQIDEHAATLSKKRRQLVRYDDYGTRDTSRWNREIERFLNNPELGPYIQRYISLPDARVMINQALTAYQGSLPVVELEFDPGMSGEDYERYCSAILANAGWSVEETPTSGDQGADILATRGDIKVAIQCKRYASNVGNAAVQQAFAATAFYKAEHAAVVTNADYTPSAIELAEGIGVLLLHHEDLRVLHERV